MANKSDYIKILWSQKWKKCILLTHITKKVFWEIKKKNPTNKQEKAINQTQN